MDPKGSSAPLGIKTVMLGFLSQPLSPTALRANVPQHRGAFGFPRQPLSPTPLRAHVPQRGGAGYLVCRKLCKTSDAVGEGSSECVACTLHKKGP